MTTLASYFLGVRSAALRKEAGKSLRMIRLANKLHILFETIIISF